MHTAECTARATRLFFVLPSGVGFVVRARWIGDLFAVMLGLSGAGAISALQTPADADAPDASPCAEALPETTAGAPRLSVPR